MHGLIKKNYCKPSREKVEKGKGKSKKERKTKERGRVKKK
jgi:hypothetical protein